jgi:hypothetical protein
MTGYDQKQVCLSHQSREPVPFRLEVDLDGNGLWCPYQSSIFDFPLRILRLAG